MVLEADACLLDILEKKLAYKSKSLIGISVSGSPLQLPPARATGGHTVAHTHCCFDVGI